MWIGLNMSFLGINWRKLANTVAPIADTYMPGSGAVLRTIGREKSKPDAKMVRELADVSGNPYIKAGAEVALGGVTMAEPYLQNLAHSQYQKTDYAKRAKEASDALDLRYKEIEADLNRKREAAQNSSAAQDITGFQRRISEIEGMLTGQQNARQGSKVSQITRDY